VDLHRFEDLTFHFDADPDPDGKSEKFTFFTEVPV
jgi:hypothetical protein